MSKKNRKRWTWDNVFYRRCYNYECALGYAHDGICTTYISLRCTECPYKYIGVKPPGVIKYKLYRLWWMWKHRKWMPTRQKRKAFERDWRKIWVRSK